MKQLVWKVLVVILTLSVLHGQGLAEDERLTRLSAEHRKWLEENVVYIILARASFPRLAGGWRWLVNGFLGA